ncbi:MAG TPA: NAD(+)/NADH kinase [Dehalococcoidia bacterium]
MKKVGIFVHSQSEAAGKLAQDVREFAASHGTDDVWISSDWEASDLQSQIPGTELLICLGGDGTVLHAARSVIPHEIPILGVNLGRLGFLAEVRPADLKEYLPRLLAGDYRLELRTMLQAKIPEWGVTYHALNDVVVGRKTVSRPVYVDVTVNDSRLAIHRCDAVIVATATGSTAYSLSAGGPILHPESADLIITPVSTHMAVARPIVMPADTTIDLTVSADKDAIVSVDGQIDHDLDSGQTVTICQSAHCARFVRFSEPKDYYALLSERLDWLRVLRTTDNPELFDLDVAAMPQ